MSSFFDNDMYKVREVFGLRNGGILSYFMFLLRWVGRESFISWM